MERLKLVYVLKSARVCSLSVSFCAHVFLVLVFMLIFGHVWLTKLNTLSFFAHVKLP